MKITHEISEILVQNKFIKSEERSICEYGIEVILTWGSEILCIFALSLYIGNWIDTLIYFIAFIPIRLFGGGYHANSRRNCFLILIVVYIVFSLILRYIPLEESRRIVIILSLFSIVPIFLWAPLKNKNKTTSEPERKSYRKISIICWCADVVFILLMILMGVYNHYILSFSLGLISATLALIVGKFKDYLKGGIIR